MVSLGVENSTSPAQSLLLAKKLDSGLGPDGIPYSAWKSNGRLAKILYRAVCHCILTGELPDDATCSIMVFLAKGEEESDGVVLAESEVLVCP